MGLTVVAAMSASFVFAFTPVSAAVVTLTCTQTGATNTPFSLSINNADDEVIQATAKDCGGALTIPIGVRKIGFGAFVPWTQDGTNSPMTNANITSISISNTVTHIHVGGFINLTNVQTLHIPGNVISVIDQAFQGMTSLRSVTIDGSPTSTPTFLGRYAFNEDTIDLVLGSGKIDLGYDFGAGSTIRSVDLGTGLLSIGNYAFSQQRFSDLTIPPSVTTISEKAFYQMPNLREIKFGPNTPGITSIHATAFDQTNITAIQYCGGNSVIDTFITAQLPNADVYCNASITPTSSTTTTTPAPTTTSLAPSSTTPPSPATTPPTTLAFASTVPFSAPTTTTAPRTSTTSSPASVTPTTTFTTSTTMPPSTTLVPAELNTVAMVERFVGVSTEQVSTLAEQADVDGGAAIIVDGQVLPVKTNTSLTSTKLTYMDASLTVQCFDKDGKELQLSGESRFIVRRGYVIRVSVSGFKPNTRINFAMFSTPTALGAVTADALGSGRQQWQIPDSISPGNHTLVATGNLPKVGDTTFGLRIVIDSKSLMARISSSNSVRALLLIGVFAGLLIPANRRRRKTA